jgi:hypothetical protein
MQHLCALLLLLQPPKAVPFEEKLHAVAYINSNCGAQSGRSDIMRALIKLGDKLKVGAGLYESGFFCNMCQCPPPPTHTHTTHTQTQQQLDPLPFPCPIPSFLQATSCKDPTLLPGSWCLFLLPTKCVPDQVPVQTMGGGGDRDPRIISTT